MLSEVVKTWIEDTFQSLNPVQRAAIPLIINRETTLIMSPTGSGKTLSAFLGIISELLHLEQKNQLDSRVYCLYISPLKALSNDIEKNLEIPLAEMKKKVKTNILIAKRSGDTTASERVKIARKPPHILLTTPESFALMLASPKFKKNLAFIQWIIIDEIHSLAENKRGSLLSLCLEQLEYIAHGKIARIGLSATIEPPELIAQYLRGNKDDNITIVDYGKLRHIEISVIAPIKNIDHAPYRVLQENQLQLIKECLEENTTTLIFANTRHMAEKLSYGLKKLFEGKLDDHIATHHSSVDKKLRLLVEDSLKKGQMKAVLTSTSLEMGIDIGSIDMTVQLGSSKTVSSLLQRIGRSGHAQDLTAKGKILVYNRDDLIESMILAKMALDGDIEDIVIPEAPADVLMQFLVALSLEKKWFSRDAYDLIIQSYPYRNLPYDQFLIILEAASNPLQNDEGWKYGNLWYDKETGEFGKRRRSRQAFLQNVGTIPSMSIINVQLEGYRSIIGQVSEKFAEKLKSNDVFILNGRTFQYLRPIGKKIIVREVFGIVPTIPSWTGEAKTRTWDISKNISQFYTKLEEKMVNDRPSQIKNWITNSYPVTLHEAEIIFDYLMHQKNFTPLPLINRIIIEKYSDPSGSENILVLSIFGRETNIVISQALAKALSNHLDINVAVIATDNGFLLRLSSGVSFNHSKLFSLISSSTLESLFIESLKDTELFRNRFRHATTRALMILQNYGKHKTSFDQQMKLSRWLYKQLPSDFVVINETIREILYDTFNLNRAKIIIQQIMEKQIDTISLPVNDIPSPMTHGILLNDNLDLIFIEDKRSLLLNLHKQVLSRLLPEIGEITNLLPRNEVISYFSRKLHVDYTSDKYFSFFSFLEQSWHYENKIEFFDKCELMTGLPTSEIEELIQNNSKIVEIPNSTYIKDDILPLLTLIKSEDFLANLTLPTELENIIKSSYIHLTPEEAVENLIYYYLKYNGPTTLNTLKSILTINTELLQGVINRLLSVNEILVGNFISTEKQYILLEDRDFFQKLMYSKSQQGINEDAYHKFRLWKFRLSKANQLINLNPINYFEENGPVRDLIELLPRIPNMNIIDITKLIHSHQIIYGKFFGRRLVYIHHKYLVDFMRLVRTDQTLDEFTSLVFEVITTFPGSNLKYIQNHVQAKSSDIQNALTLLESELYIARTSLEPVITQLNYSNTGYIALPNVSFNENKYLQSVKNVIKLCFKWYGFLSLNDILRITRLPYPIVESTLKSLLSEIESFTLYNTLYYGLPEDFTNLNNFITDDHINHELHLLIPTDPFFYTISPTSMRFTRNRITNLRIVFGGVIIGNIELSIPQKDILQVINIQIKQSFRKNNSLIQQIGYSILNLSKKILQIRTVIIEDIHFKSPNDPSNASYLIGFLAAGYKLQRDYLIGSLHRISQFDIADILETRQLIQKKYVNNFDDLETLFTQHPTIHIDKLQKAVKIRPEHLQLILSRLVGNKNIHIYQDYVIIHQFWSNVTQSSEMVLPVLPDTFTEKQLLEVMDIDNIHSSVIQNLLKAKQIEVANFQGFIQHFRVVKDDYQSLSTNKLIQLVVSYLEMYGPINFIQLKNLINELFVVGRIELLMSLSSLLEEKKIHSLVLKDENIKIDELIYYTGTQKILLEDTTRKSLFDQWEIHENDGYLFDMAHRQDTHIITYQGEVIISFHLKKNIDEALIKNLHFHYKFHSFNFEDNLSDLIKHLENFLFSMGFKVVRILKIQSAFPATWQELIKS